MKKFGLLFLTALLLIYGYMHTPYAYNYKNVSDSPPPQKVMEKLCIVTGADSNYFEMIVELIESIKATKHYKNVPLCIIDCGLTKKEIEFLKNKYNAWIKDPGWDTPVQKNTPNYYKVVTSKAFHNIHFPGYRYYLWIDGDAWVHNEWALNRTVNLSVEQGWAIAAENLISPLYFLKGIKCIPFWDLMKVLFKYHLNVGLYCIDGQTDYFKKWQNYLKNITYNGQKFMSEEWAANHIYYQNNLSPLMKAENYIPIFSGLPIVSKKDNTLRHPLSYKPIGVLHLVNNKVARGKNSSKYAPLKIKEEKLTWIEWLINLYNARRWNYRKPTLEECKKPGYRCVSICYTNEKQ